MGKATGSACAGSVRVQAFLDELEHPHKASIEALRRLVLGLDTRIREDIKWNAPSFLIEDHFATFKLHPFRTIQIVLHTGAKVKPGQAPFAVDDPCGLLKWAAPDRCVLTLRTAEEADANQDAIATIVRQWIGQL
jgi:hypothetical protein